MDIVRALSEGWPGSLWTLEGDDYSGLIWQDAAPKPTEQQIADKLVELEALEASEAQRQAGVKASAYVTQWDDALKNKTVTQIKTLFDGATAQQKSDLLFYLLLVRALDVRG